MKQTIGQNLSHWIEKKLVSLKLAFKYFDVVVVPTFSFVSIAAYGTALGRGMYRETERVVMKPWQSLNVWNHGQDWMCAGRDVFNIVTSFPVWCCRHTCNRDILYILIYIFYNTDVSKHCRNVPSELKHVTYAEIFSQHHHINCQEL